MLHVLNRSVSRLTLFEQPVDYAALMRAVDKTWQKNPLPTVLVSGLPGTYFP
tara:strand:- start:244812 stop:244967 length:156 start_codon:yes stop_codon:yes gene_type:complete